MAQHDYLLRNAQAWADEYTDVLFEQIRPKVEWNARFMRTLALASMDDDDRCAIEISSKIYPTLAPHDRVKTIAHEVCHLVAWSRHGFGIKDHGPEWLELMTSLGYPDASGYVEVHGPTPKGGHLWPKKARRSG